MDQHFGQSTGQPAAEPQPLLFDSLPRAESLKPRRRRARPAAEGEGAAAADAPVPAALEAPAAMPAPAAAPMAPASPEPLDPAALTNPELRALVQGLPDLRLAFLIVEAARELRRRVAPDDGSESDGPIDPPNPSLLRAARLTVGELTGDDA